MVDSNEQVIVQRGKDRAYALVAVGKEDKFFMHPPTIARIKDSISQAKEGKVTKVKAKDLDQLLGL